MDTRESGQLAFVLTIGVTIAAFLVSREIGCHFATLMWFVARAVIVIGVAGALFYFGLDALLTIALASLFLWVCAFPVIDSIALGGIDPDGPFRVQALPSSVPAIKYTILCVLAGLAGWRTKRVMQGY